MTSRRSSRRSRRTRGQATPVNWCNSQSTPITAAIGGAVVFDLLQAPFVPSLYEDGYTIRRMIAEVTMRATASNFDVFGSFGMTVANKDAGASLPDPILDLAGWYWHKNFFIRDVGGNAVVRFDIDTKTMRKVRGAERSLFWILTNNAASLASLSVSVAARFVLSR